MGNKSYKSLPQVIHPSLQNLIEEEVVVLYLDRDKKEDSGYTMCLQSGKSWLKCNNIT